MPFEFTKATRKSVPMLISISGTSGSGKTYSALLIAAGLAGKDGKVFFADTENGRGEMYADSPGITKALPQGFSYGRMDAPFSPVRHREIIGAAEAAGATVLILDSMTHEWEGFGGCQEIAEEFKLKGMPNWARAKMDHKRLMNYLLSTNMHIVFCLRAREKVKIQKDEKGKEQIIPLGIQPITEKNFVYEMLLSLQLDEASHKASPIKVPEPLMGIFGPGKLLTKEDGERIRQWNEGGASLDPFEQIRKRARAAASNGKAAYRAYFETLTAQQKQALCDSIHEELKMDAEMADAEAEKLLAQEGGRDE